VKALDSIVPFVILGFGYTFTLLLLPEFVGEGLLKLSLKSLTLNQLMILNVCFALASFFIILRGSLKDIALTLQNFGRLIGRKCLKLIQASWTYLRKVFKGQKKVIDFEKMIGRFGVGLKRAGANNNKSFEQDRVEDSYQKMARKIQVEEIETISEPIPSLSSAEGLPRYEEAAPSTEVKPKKAPARKPKKKVDSFFESKQLIDCIATDEQKINIQGPDDEYFSSITESIQNKLAEFNIEARVVNILKGPVVDTFELELGAGVKVSKITGLSDDIGLALGSYVRVVIQMKGKSTIGIEVPRNPREIIYLDEVLRSESYKNSRHRLPVAMGKNAFGEPYVVDLAGMPHMLVAGATGAGKSVFINTLLVSLIVKKSHMDLKLILIDPKQLELALYQRLPHLLMPVVTDHQTASIALLWAVQEMERRYTILKEMGMRDIEGFNRKVQTASADMLGRIHQHYEDGGDSGYELPYLVIIIDEFADLILTKNGKDIETNVSRLAAKARAAGIHLVVATQRPSTDVITGVIKSNFPTRVSFRVTTNTDSRVVLDSNGAERLLGKGDMLYKNGIDLSRYHSAYVDEEEIEGLVDMLATVPSEYDSHAMDFLENGGEDEDSAHGPVTVTVGSGKDAKYDDAVKVVIENGSASASMLQRRLGVGYNRAANLIEALERDGIVGPQQGSKPRKVLVSGGE
jgi:S-DNA-T family DNA segregation ATPase FtsK/SpoIIIE